MNDDASHADCCVTMTSHRPAYRHLDCISSNIVYLFSVY